MNSRLYARASTAGAVLCTAAACYATTLDAGWIALGGLHSALLLAYNARRCHTLARRERAIEQRLKRLGQDQAPAAVLPPPCCSFWLHSDGEVHSPSDCTRPRAARTALTLAQNPPVTFTTGQFAGVPAYRADTCIPKLFPASATPNVRVAVWLEP